MTETKRSQPIISVIVPVFNNCFYTRLCVESLWKSRGIDSQFEVVIVDNGSTDDTEFYLESLDRNFHRVIKNETNRGFAVASNQGAAIAQGDYLLFLNNDVCVEPDCLKALLSCIQSSNDIGAVGARLFYPDGTIQHAGVVFDTEGHPFHVYCGYPPDWPEALIQKDYQAITGACLLAKKSLFNEAGTFDERYRNSFEDVDLCFRIRQTGHRTVYCPQATAYHFESSTPGRLLRDDNNFSLFLKQWSDTLRADYDPCQALTTEIKGVASLVRLELNNLVQRVRLLEDQNFQLKKVVREPRYQRVSVRPDDLHNLREPQFDAVYRPAPLLQNYAGNTKEVAVVLENLGTVSWCQHQMQLSYHWMQFESNAILAWDGIRTIIQENVEPGQTICVSATVKLPDVPGKYWLEWDLLSEGEAWFSQRGVIPYRQLAIVESNDQPKALIQGLPTIVNTGDALEIALHVGGSLCHESIENLIVGWRWNLIGNIINNKYEFKFVVPNLRLTEDSTFWNFDVVAPAISGTYELEIHGWKAGGNNAITIDAIGAVTHVLNSNGTTKLQGKISDYSTIGNQNSLVRNPESINAAFSLTLEDSAYHLGRTMKLIRQITSQSEKNEVQSKVPGSHFIGSQSALGNARTLESLVRALFNRINDQDKKSQQQQQRINELCSLKAQLDLKTRQVSDLTNNLALTQKELGDTVRLVEDYRNGRVMRLLLFFQGFLQNLGIVAKR